MEKKNGKILIMSNIFLHKNMESYIEDKKNLCMLIHKLIEESDEYNSNEVCNECFQQLINFNKSQQIEEDVEEMRQFLEIIKNIGENHHRNQHLNEVMNQIILHNKDQIKQNLTDMEIFHIFENNKKIVLFLLKLVSLQFLMKFTKR